MTVKRAKWITPLSLMLGWLSIGGFGNFYVMQKHQEFGTIPLSIFALLYGILALVTCLGLWKMKNWSFITFSLWSVNAIVGMLIFLFTFMADAPMLGPGIFIIVFSTALFFVAKYIKKVVNIEP